jgi:hypothetical protein
MLAADPASKSALKKRLDLFSSASQPAWLNDKHGVVFVESQNSLQVELTDASSSFLTASSMVFANIKRSVLICMGS